MPGACISARCSLFSGLWGTNPAPPTKSEHNKNSVNLSGQRHQAQHCGRPRPAHEHPDFIMGGRFWAGPWDSLGSLARQSWQKSGRGGGGGVNCAIPTSLRSSRSSTERHPGSPQAQSTPHQPPGSHVVRSLGRLRQVRSQLRSESENGLGSGSGPSLGFWV